MISVRARGVVGGRDGKICVNDGLHTNVTASSLVEGGVGEGKAHQVELTGQYQEEGLESKLGT